ncbi:MAG TPA: hypothetical protein VNQ76_18920 [Planctomicrobium sp.]|nr:hypothetical protein [Planctomicrobium sp.]
MKIVKHWFLSLLLIVVALLSARLSWKLCVSETGWSPFLDQWTSVVPGFVGIQQQRLGDRDPVEQARFWLREVERCGKANDDPEMAMGAAWMLDSPQTGFIRRHFRLKDDLNIPGLPMGWRRELDTETIATLAEEFESICRDKCLAKIERAIQLDSSNRELRRAHAFMLFQNRILSLDFKPRQDGCRMTLYECSQVDPDNALYDYLAALCLWTSSADYSYEENGYVLNIHNKNRYEEGNAHLAAGLEKADLKFETNGYAATLKFLNETKIPRADSLEAAESRHIDGRATNLLYHIMRWKGVECDVEKRNEKFDAAIDAVRHVLAISEQIRESENTTHPLHSRLILRRWSLANLEDIHKNHPDVISPEEAIQVSNQLADVRLELEILDEIGRRTNAKNSEPDSGLSLGSITAVIKVLSLIFLLSITPVLVTMCILLAFIFSLISAIFGKGLNAPLTPFGVLRHVVVWSVATSVSFILLGMFPAEIVSPQVQTWLVGCVIWIGFALLLLGILYLLQRNFQLTARHVAGVAIVTSLPMIAIAHGANIIDLAVAGIAFLHPAATVIVILLLFLTGWRSLYFLWTFVTDTKQSRRHKLFAAGTISLIVLAAIFAGTALGAMSHDIEVQTWISAKVWEEAQGLHIDAQELQNVMKLSDSKWIWAFIQWLIHYGPAFVPIIAVIILMVWQLIRRARQVEGGLSQILRSQKRSELRQVCHPVVKSCVVVALVFLAFHLGIASTVPDKMDAYYRVHSVRIAEPMRVWDDIIKQMGEIRADEETMARLQANVDERNRQFAEQEARLNNEE